MSHVILLDRNVGVWGDDQYAVTFMGTRAACRAQTHHNGNSFPEPKAAYREGASESKSLIGPTGNVDSGRIVNLIPVGE